MVTKHRGEDAWRLKRWGNICDDAMVFSVTLVFQAFLSPNTFLPGHRTGLPFIHGTASPLASSLQNYTVPGLLEI